MRNCPVCKIPLRTISLQGYEVDRCNECRGLFFDCGELESIVHLVQLFQSVRLDEREIDTVPDEEKKRNLYCPEDGQVLNKKEVIGCTIDCCEDCGGIWLDHGEIAALKIAEQHIKNNITLYIRLGQ